jgi:hypothetical protein
MREPKLLLDMVWPPRHGIDSYYYVTGGL